MTSLLAIIFSILSFGAVGDGKTDNTQAITQAITQCAQQGGGTVVFPAGTYVTGTLHLQSGVTLRLEEGAVLMGNATNPSAPPSTYPGTRVDGER